MAKVRQVVSAPLSKGKQRTRAKQIGGMPDFQTPNLYAANLPPGTRWLTVAPEPDYAPGIVVGLNVRESGMICYAPVPVPRMTIDRFLVVVEFSSEYFDEIGFSDAAAVSFKLIYLSHDDEFHEQNTLPQTAKGDRFAFEVPLGHLDRNALFACSLVVTLMDTPSKPVLIRGVWLEIEGL